MRRLLPHLIAIAAWLASTGLWSDAAYIPVQPTPVPTVGLPGKSGSVGSIQGTPLGYPIGITSPSPLQTITTPATGGVVSGTANTAVSATTLLIRGVPGKRIYVTAFSCANTGSTTSLTSFQDGSGGAILWTTINPTTGGSNMAPQSPLFWTSIGNGLYFIEGSASTTAYCSAAGFAG